VLQRLFWCNLGTAVVVTKRGKFKGENGTLIGVSQLYRNGRLTVFLEGVGLKKDMHYSTIRPLGPAGPGGSGGGGGGGVTGAGAAVGSVGDSSTRVGDPLGALGLDE
jgi:hypothetical protein